MQLNQTSKFAVLDAPGVKVVHAQADEGSAGAGKQASRQVSRAQKGSGPEMSNTGRIGGAFEVSRNAPFLVERVQYFDSLWKRQQEELAAKDKPAIQITLPSGDVQEGTAFVTTPMDVAKKISDGLAQSVIISKVVYSKRYDQDEQIVACDDDHEEQPETVVEEEGEMWDLMRPLVGDCKLQLFKFNDREGKDVFWHSSAHILGAAIESLYGAHLTIGPALEQGFYYDAYMGDTSISETNFNELNKAAQEVVKKKHPFQRLVISKDEALHLFQYNPFKVNLIRNKIPDGGKTTVYRCGPLVDLCMGPHVPNTGKIKSFSIWKASSTNWLGNVQNDPLQRVYGISFPDKAMLKQWQEFQEQAKLRDHRRIGQNQELFFFHHFSPGSAFWMPHGARVYNRLMEFIRNEYWRRGYEEVISPNIYNLDLWHVSGHAAHYKDNMFTFDVEGQEWGLKPMNCPGHCLIFGHRVRSYRELPIRMADFGVLHRNEVSGALTGLTRVRRFQQDDAHIFCREDQIKDEVVEALRFMRYVYNILGMTYTLDLSTRPAKALGEIELWDRAEHQLAQALDEFAGHGNWRINPGDGAFYGPKIDIKVYDAMDRVHQCATIQLDFQMPRRFDLKFRTEENAGEDTFQHPVMVHRAMLGSVERMAAVLIEHFGGKWPFWLSPRQALVVPVSLNFLSYAREVQQRLHDGGIFVDVEDSSKTLNKKVREGQLAQYNYILVVGGQEAEQKTVNVRTRENEVKGMKSLEECVAWFKEMAGEFK